MLQENRLFYQIKAILIKRKQKNTKKIVKNGVPKAYFWLKLVPKQKEIFVALDESLAASVRIREKRNQKLIVSSCVTIKI